MDERLLDAIRRHAADSSAFPLFEHYLEHSAVDLPEVTRLLRMYHWTNPRLGRLAFDLAEYDDPLADELADVHPERAIRGLASFAVGRMAKIRAVTAARAGKPLVKRNTFRVRAEKYLTLAAEKYADVPGPEGGTVGELAAGELAGLKNVAALTVGGTAPELAGEGLDGKPIMLSEYRNGRVCVVVFWGSWCGPCMRVVPKERALVEKYDAKDFCILGVNGLDAKPAAVAAAEKTKMSWPSVWDGGKTGGALAAAWNVQARPTVWVIDRAGVVRYVGHDEEGDLEAAVEKAIGR